MVNDYVKGEKEEIKYLDSLMKYRPAAVATKFYQEKNETAAKGALEKLVSTLDIGEDGPAMLKAIREGREGDKTLASIYAPEYEKILMGAKVKDLFEFYSDHFKKYIEGDSYDEAVKVFNEYGNETYKDMYAKVIEAQEKLSSKSPNVTDEDREKAKKTIEKYGRITMPIQNFENLELKKLADPLEDTALKKDLTAMFKPAGEKE